MTQELSHLTVMQVVRRNILEELLQKSTSSEVYRDELVQFITLEPMNLTPEIFARVRKILGGELALGNFPTFSILDHNPRPYVESWGPTGLKNYVRQWFRYVICKIILRFLPRLITTNVELRGFSLAETHRPSQNI